MTDELIMGGPEQEQDAPTPKKWTPPAVPAGAKRLTKADIAAADDLAPVELYVEALGGTVLVKGLDRLEFHAARKRATDRKGVLDLEVMERWILAQGLVEPKYTNADIADLMRKSMGAVQEISDAIGNLSGMTKEEREEAATSFLK